MRSRRGAVGVAVLAMAYGVVWTACTGEDPVIPSGGVEGGVDGAIDTSSTTDAAGEATTDARPAGPGDLDPAFANGEILGPGKQPLGLDSVHAIAVNAEGKVYVAGGAKACVVSSPNPGSFRDFGVVRLDVAGGADTTFGTNSRACVDVGTGGGRTDDDATAIAILPSGAVLLAGSSANPYKNIGDAEYGPRAAVARLDDKGRVDPSFFDAGAAFRVNPLSDVLGYPVAIALDSGGAYYVGGVSIPPDGATGQGSWVMRFRADGSVDTGFNGAGFLSTNLGGVYGLAVFSGDIFLSGGSTQFAITRYRTTGAEVPPWGTGPINASPGGESQARAMTAAGALFVATIANRATDAKLASGGVVKYLDDAGLDPTFNPSGAKPGVFVTGELKWNVTEQLTGIAVQKDGKVLLAGVVDGGAGSGADLAVLRLLPNGTPDTSFGQNGIARTRAIGDETMVAMALDPSANRVVVLGRNGSGLPVVYRFLL